MWFSDGDTYYPDDGLDGYQSDSFCDTQLNRCEAISDGADAKCRLEGGTLENGVDISIEAESSCITTHFGPFC